MTIGEQIDMASFEYPQDTFNIHCKEIRNIIGIYLSRSEMLIFQTKMEGIVGDMAQQLSAATAPVAIPTASSAPATVTEKVDAARKGVEIVYQG